MTLRFSNKSLKFEHIQGAMSTHKLSGDNRSSSPKRKRVCQQNAAQHWQRFMFVMVHTALPTPKLRGSGSGATRLFPQQATSGEKNSQNSCPGFPLNVDNPHPPPTNIVEGRGSISPAADPSKAMGTITSFTSSLSCRLSLRVPS